MKYYIKPEAEVYKVGIVSPLCGSGAKPEGGQIEEGDAKVNDYFLFDEGNGDGHTGRRGLWDDEDFEDGMNYSK